MTTGLFLLRGFNDIDYTVPVLDRLLREGTIDVRAVLVDPFYDERGDTRLRYLEATHGFAVRSLYDGAPGATGRLFRVIRRVVASAIRQSALGRRLNALLTLLWSWQLPRIDASTLADALSREGPPAFVAFDHAANALIANLIAELRRRGTKAVMVPGGTVMITNMLWHPTQVTRDQARAASPPPLADVILFGTANERDRHDVASLPAHHVIGVPRYCDEWMRHSQDLRESNAVGFLNTGRGDLNRRIATGFEDARRQPARLKIAYMGTFADTGVWVDEMVRTVRLIADFDDVVIATKFKPTNHTPKVAELFQQLTAPPNSFVMPASVSSSALIEWADVVMVNVSSIALEAIQRGKPVWYLAYLQSVDAVFDTFDVAWRMRTRDDVVRAVERAREAPTYRPYSDGAVERFRREFIHGGVPGGDVLGRAAAVLTAIAERRPVREPAVAAGVGTR